MKHIIFLLISTLFLSVGYSQERVYSYQSVPVHLSLPADTALQHRADDQANLLQLSGFERDMLYSLNYCRVHPAVFLKKAVLPYLEAYPVWKPVYGESLITDLQALPGLQPLVADDKLAAIARLHSADLGKHNQMRHESFDGTTTRQRFQKIGVVCGSECINMGNFPNALEVLISLLIDYGVANYGHRKAILNPAMKKIGIGAARNVAGTIQYTVLDMSCD